MINSVGSSSSNVFFISQRDEINRNSYVSELNANHTPNNENRAFIESVVSHYTKAESKSSRDKIAVNINEYMNDIDRMRGRVFEIVNENTDHVYGKLREGYTEVDRDNYIQKLNTVFELNDEIKKIKEYKGFASGKTDDALYLHHSSTLYGDLKNLDLLKKGHRAVVPYFSYNKGTTQFG